MSQLLLNMAQQAVEDPALMAGLIDTYTKQTNSTWAEIAGELHVNPSQLAKLALCRQPNGNAHQEIRQIADYVKMSPVVLNHFYNRTQNGESVSSNKSTSTRKTVGTTKQASKNQGRNFSIGRSFMSKRFVWTAGLVVVLLLIVSAFVMAQTTAVSEATLVVNSGEVTIARGGKTGTAVPGETVVVSEGDTVTTNATGTAQLHLADGGTVDLFAATSVEITELVTTEEKYQVTLTMLAGRTLNRVVHLLGIEDHYEVRSPSSTASVRGTVFTVDVFSQKSTYVGVDEGVVNVAMGDQSVDVEAGFEVTAVTGELLMVKPQHQETPSAEPTIAPTPTDIPPTPAPTDEPSPTEVPEEESVANTKNGGKEEGTKIVPMPIFPPTAVGPGVIPGQLGDGDDPTTPSDPSDDSNNDPDKENGGNPHEGMVVPGNTPGDGQTPEGGAEPPGQGGTPPGQTDNPGNGGDNNSGGNSGGKKDK